MNTSGKNQKEVDFHAYLARHIDSCKLTQREIAEKLGYQNPNVITMFKKGRSKFPIYSIPKLSELIGLDPASTLRIALEAYDDPVFPLIEQYFGALISKNEQTLLKAYREYTNNSDPNTTSSSAKVSIRRLAEELVG